MTTTDTTTIDTTTTEQSDVGDSTPVAPVRLYTLDGGLTEFDDAQVFSDTGEYKGRSISLPTPVYLVQHGDQWLVWDTGNGDRLADQPEGEEKFGGRFTQPTTLRSQLAQLGLEPEDITYVALSHLHQDHTGNIGLFPSSTFLVDADELAYAFADPTPFGVELPPIAPLREATVEEIVLDRDVFGDGTVQVLKSPGHTPGSVMLFVDLPSSGPVLISGDLFHTRENYEKTLVPVVNTSRAETMASMDRFNRIVANTGARVVIQHAPEDFEAMPTFPEYLD